MDSLSTEPGRARRTPWRDHREGRSNVTGVALVGPATTECRWFLVGTPPPRGQRSIESP